MAITKLTTSQIDTLVNAAYTDAVGGDTLTQLDLTALVDEGVSDVAALRSKFTGKLLGLLTENFFTQTSAEGEYDDPFFQNESEFGAITQMISASVPDAQVNPAWQDFVSGTSTVGEYTVYLPTIDTSYYTKQTAWSIPLTITGQQWKQAFKDEGGVRRFVDFLQMVMGNAILKHRENMNEENRNNFIAQKIQYSAGLSATGIHVVDLVAKYVSERGIATAFSVEDAMASDDFKAFAMSTLGEYAGYLKKQTSIFTIDSSVRFVPSDRLIVQILDKFDRECAVTKAGIYHNDLIKMPGYRTVSAWQGLGDLSFDKLSAMKGKTSAGAYSYSGIVGIMVDKWAIMHTIKNQRVASQHFPIEDLTHFSYQFVDAYLNNLNMPGVIFTMNDYTPNA